MIHGRIPILWKGFEYRDTPHYDLLAAARGLCRQGEELYLGRVLELIDSGSELTALPHPVDEASQARRAALLADKKDIQEYIEAAEAGTVMMERIKEAMGDLFPEKGIVRHEEYDEAKRALGQIKEQVIEKFSRSKEVKIGWEESWPFDD